MSRSHQEPLQSYVQMLRNKKLFLFVLEMLRVRHMRTIGLTVQRRRTGGHNTNR